MKQVSLTKVDVIFQCFDCNTYDVYSIIEAMDNVPPTCESCGGYMDAIECEIDTE